MANTFVWSGIVEEDSGAFKPVLKFRDPIQSVSGIFYVVFSDVNKTPSETDWGTGYPITGFENRTYGEHRAKIDQIFSIEDVWNKHALLKFEGTVDDNPISWDTNSQYIGVGITINYRDEAYRDESYKNGDVFLLFDRFKDSGLQFFDYSFVDEVYFDIEYYEGSELKTKSSLLSATAVRGDDASYRELPVTDSNYCVKRVDIIINTNDGDEMITTYEPDLVILKNAVKTITLTNIKELDIAGIHGSVIHNGYVYGSARHTYGQYNIVKISSSDPNDISYVKLLHSNNTMASELEQIIVVKGMLYTLSTLSLFQINPDTLEYREFKFASIEATAMGTPVAGDDEFLYITDTGKAYKVDVEGLQNSAIGLPDYSQYIVAQTDYSDNTDLYKSKNHSAVVDDTYFYVGATTAAPYNLIKFLKSDMSLVSYTPILKATDDMTDDSEFCYLGKEVLEVTGNEYGKNVGAFAAKKSNLELKLLAKLSQKDQINPNDSTANSYASLFFGDFLFDFKVNHQIYQLNALITDDWSLDIPGMATVQHYTYPDNQGIINEVVFDPENQTFHAFFWNNNGFGKSKYATFQIPDMLIFLAPSVTGVGYTSNIDDFTLMATISSTGGVPISEAYFEIMDINEEVVETINTSTSLGEKSITYENQNSFKFRFVAVNSKGTTQSPIRTVTIEVIEPPSVTDVEYTINGNSVALRATISSTGGDPVTDAYFEIMDMNEETIELLNVSTTLGLKNVDYEHSSSFKFRFVAINNTGAIYSPIQTITIDVYKFAGIVYYNDIPEADVKIYLMDIETGDIVNETITGIDGSYEFSDLDNKYYAVFGYKENKRIVTKIKLPFSE